MWSRIFKKGSLTSDETKSEKPFSPELEEKKSASIESDEPVDLSTIPSFIALVKQHDEETKANSEVPIQLIKNYLKDFDDENKSKKADIIVKELEGLMKEIPDYKDNQRVIRAVRNSLKTYCGPIVSKYMNTIHALYITPGNAKILPSLFEDFEHAFRDKVEVKETYKPKP